MFLLGILSRHLLWCRTLRFPVVVYELQGMMVLLLHLTIITRVPRQQIQGKDYGAVMGSGNALQLLEEVDCNGRGCADSTVWRASKPEDVVDIVIHVHDQLFIGRLSCSTHSIWKPLTAAIEDGHDVTAFFCSKRPKVLLKRVTDLDPLFCFVADGICCIGHDTMARIVNED